MNAAVTIRVDLPRGLTAQRAKDYFDLVAQVTGTSGAHALPWLAAALLFAEDAVQSRLSLPPAGASEILVQEYQAITFVGGITPDAPLVATAHQDRTEGSATYRFVLSDRSNQVRATLESTLRRVPSTSFQDARPSRIRPEMLQSAVCSPALSLNQNQVDTYLSLSGDGNPIHSDPGIAQAMGLPAPVVPGLLLVSLIQPYCTAAQPGSALVSLKSRFLAPLCIGLPARICIQIRGTEPATGNVRLRAYVLTPDDTALAISDLVMANGAGGQALA